MWDVYVFSVDGGLFKANKEPMAKDDAIAFAGFLSEELPALLWPSNLSLPTGLLGLLF